MEEALNKLVIFVKWISTSFTNWLTDLATFFDNIATMFRSVFSFILSIFGFLYYAWKTLIIWVWRLFKWVINSWVFVNVSQAFLDLSEYLWIGAYFIYALLFVIIIRILIAFVFKILRLNIDYNALDKNTRKANSRANTSDRIKKFLSK